MELIVNQAWLQSLHVGSEVVITQANGQLAIARIDDEHDDTHWRVGSRIYSKASGARFDGSVTPYAYIVEPAEGHLQDIEYERFNAMVAQLDGMDWRDYSFDTLGKVMQILESEGTVWRI